MEIIIKLTKIIVLGVFTDHHYYTNQSLKLQCHLSQHHLLNPRHPQRKSRPCIKQNLLTNLSLLPQRPKQISLLKICLPPRRISIVAALVLIADRTLPNSISLICNRVHKIVIAQTTLRRTSITRTTPTDSPTIITEAEALTKVPILPTQFEVKKNNMVNMEATLKTQLWEP